MMTRAQHQRRLRAIRREWRMTCVARGGILAATFGASLVGGILSATAGQPAEALLMVGATINALAGWLNAAALLREWRRMREERDQVRALMDEAP